MFDLNDGLAWIQHLPIWQQIAALFIGSYLSEDGTLVASIALARQGLIPISLAWIGNVGGILLGDAIVYAMGWGIHRGTLNWGPFIKMRRRLEEATNSTSQQKNWRDGALLFSRVIPGTRLPLYLLCGWTGYSLKRFMGLMVISTLSWVSLALFLGLKTPDLSAASLATNLLYLVVGYLALRKICSVGALLWQGKWARQAWLAGWKRWLYFEFWPPLLFYPPMVAYIAYLALRFRTLRFPFDSNPRLPNAGIIFESKWTIYREIAEGPQKLKTFLISEQVSIEQRFEYFSRCMEIHEMNLPIVIKPDRGQRGAGVRILRDLDQVRLYLETAKYDLVCQEYCAWPEELGVFYYRHPQKPQGEIFSITEKEFPFVTGDGVRSLGELIMADPRARMIAPRYFERLENSLDSIPPQGSITPLVQCGNHCQGTIFKNGIRLKTSGLLEVIDQISQSLPDFYIGRFDLRFQSEDGLAAGQFKIIEINASGAEATHIYDRRMTLLAAYGVLFQQWRLIFEIGRENYRAGRRSTSTLWSFLRDCLRYKKLAKDYSISS